jgi:choline transport protein
MTNNIISVFSFVLYDGGTALLFWGFVAIGLGMMLVYASLAEMASMWANRDFRCRVIKLIYSEGVQQLVDNITGCLSSRLQSTKRS